MKTSVVVFAIRSLLLPAAAMCLFPFSFAVVSGWCDLNEASGGPLIWIVDCEQWPRAALRAELIERGYGAVGHILLGESLTKLHAVSPQARPRAIVLELRSQKITRGILQELAQSSIPTIILGGTVELNEPAIQGFKWTAVLKRPVTLGEIADLLEKLVPPQGH
jgi:hypothetical protein